MPPFHSRSTGAVRIARISSGGLTAWRVAQVERRPDLRGDRDRLGGTREDAAARADQLAGRSRPTTSAAARTAAAARRTRRPRPGSGSRKMCRWSNAATSRMCSESSMPLPNTSPDMSPTPTTVKSSRLGVDAHVAEVPLHRLPGAPGGDAHLLVVVAGRAAGGEGVAEPEVLASPRSRWRCRRTWRCPCPRPPPGTGRRRRAAPRRPAARSCRRRMLSVTSSSAVMNSLVAGDGLVPVARLLLEDEAALGADRHDHRVLHHLRLDQAEHLGAEVLPPVRPAQAAPGHRAEPQVHALEPGRVHEDLELRPGRGQVRDRPAGPA